jgi:hypothetical protein
MENNVDSATLRLVQEFLDKFDFYMFRCKSPVNFGNMMKAHHALKKRINEIKK